MQKKTVLTMSQKVQFLAKSKKVQIWTKSKKFNYVSPSVFHPCLVQSGSSLASVSPMFRSISHSRLASVSLMSRPLSCSSLAQCFTHVSPSVSHMSHPVSLPCLVRITRVSSVSHMFQSRLSHIYSYLQRLTRSHICLSNLTSV